MSDFGLSSTISTWGNVLTDYYGTKYDKQENELAYSRALENRDYMNRYNSPAAQMQRLREAGLNPNLMYGQGTVGNQEHPQRYNPTKATKSNKRIDPINIATLAQARKTDAEAEGQEIQNKYSLMTFKNRSQQEHYKNNLLKMQADQELMKYNVLHENYDAIKEMTYRTMRNQMTESDFNAWLARNRMNKNDTLAARKLFQWAQETGFDKRLSEMFLKRYQDY